jgi:hypothetical protein
MTRLSAFFFLFLSLVVAGSHGFINQSPAFTRGRQIDSYQSSLSATTEGLPFQGGPTLQSPLMTTLTSLLMTLSTDPAASLDPSVGAELLTDMAHVSLDFAGMFSPSKSLIRLFAVVGRIFVISADYLPDHSIHPEELLIQLFLLTMTMKDLNKEKTDPEQA